MLSVHRNIRKMEPTGLTYVGITLERQLASWFKYVIFRIVGPLPELQQTLIANYRGRTNIASEGGR